MLEMMPLVTDKWLFLEISRYFSRVKWHFISLKWHFISENYLLFCRKRLYL